MTPEPELSPTTASATGRGGAGGQGGGQGTCTASGGQGGGQGTCTAGGGQGGRGQGTQTALPLPLPLPLPLALDLAGTTFAFGRAKSTMAERRPGTWNLCSSEDLAASRKNAAHCCFATLAAADLWSSASKPCHSYRYWLRLAILFAAVPCTCTARLIVTDLYVTSLRKQHNRERSFISTQGIDHMFSIAMHSQFRHHNYSRSLTLADIFRFSRHATAFSARCCLYLSILQDIKDGFACHRNDLIMRGFHRCHTQTSLLTTLRSQHIICSWQNAQYTWHRYRSQVCRIPVARIRLIEQARALPAWTSLKDNSVALRSS